jgi:hypothetical protein
MTITLWVNRSNLNEFFKVVNLLENNIYVLPEDLRNAKKLYSTRPLEGLITLNISIKHYFQIENA